MNIIFQSFPALSTDTSFDFGQTVVTAYWEIGEQIYKACGENDRAGYGKHLLRFFSRQLTSEFGKGFYVANLKENAPRTKREIRRISLFQRHRKRSLQAVLRGISEHLAGNCLTIPKAAFRTAVVFGTTS